MQIWVKNFNQSSIMYLYVLQSYENLFNANGYLGYNREYFNAPNVFIFASDFNNFNGWNGENQYVEFDIIVSSVIFNP